MKISEETSPLRMPKLCAWCGVTARRISARSSLLLPPVLLERNTTFQLPICPSCQKQIDKADSDSLVSGWKCAPLFGLVAGIATILFFPRIGLPSTLGARLILAAPFAFLAGCIGFWIAKRHVLRDSLGPDDWGRISGGRFSFKNPDFHNRFAVLNPSLVSNHTARAPLGR
jgi:hypothetical protein